MVLLFKHFIHISLFKSPEVLTLLSPLTGRDVVKGGVVGDAWRRGCVGEAIRFILDDTISSDALELLFTL